MVDASNINNFRESSFKICEAQSGPYKTCTVILEADDELRKYAECGKELDGGDELHD